jgi:SLT domain-containing protein
MQTIGPTFASNALPGHGDIWNPVDNIIAGVRYSISRYGSVSNVPGVAGLRSGGGYQGY